jgi:putative DNA primase/helicase
LAFWTGRDAVRIDSLFRQSGLYRDKWERQDYREHTIDEAIKLTGQTYDSNRNRSYPRAVIPSNGEPSSDSQKSEPGVPDLLNGYDPEDVGNGQRFLTMCPDIVRWCPEREKWLLWDGRHWGLDHADQVRDSLRK